MLQDQIQENLKQAQLNRNEIEVSTLRMLLSELKYAQIKKGSELSDLDIIGIVQKEIKKRNEAASGFRSGGREEAALKEDSEAKILEKYLPPQMSDQQLEDLITKTIAEVGAASLSDMGKVIGKVKTEVGTSADPGRIAGLVKQKLSI